MISPQVTEWATFISTNMTVFGSNVYPEFTEIERNADIFCTIDLEVLDDEEMDSGKMYFGYVRLTFVAPDPLTLDQSLVDKLDYELSLKSKQFTTFTYGGVGNVSKTTKYKPDIDNLLKREVDIRMSWYIAN